MKRGKWTKITAVLFAAAMLVSLSACGDTPPATGNPTTTTSTTTTMAKQTTTTTTETTTATTTTTTTKKPTTTTTATTTTTTTTTTTAVYIPNTKKTAELTEQQRTKILTEFAQQIWDGEKTHQYSSVDEMLAYFSLDGYYGEYNKYKVVKLDTFEGPMGFTEIEVDGYCFAISGGEQYYLYKDAQFWELKYGYELGLVNESDLKDIWYYCYGKFPTKGSVIIVE